MNTEQQYILAFNNGYMLAQYEPKLLNAISKNLAPINNYLEGFFDGKEQLEYEKDNTQLLVIETLRDQSKNRSRELDRE